MEFIDTIRDDADQIWSAILKHPMIQRLGDGSLREDRFQYWVRQDYVYLIEYNRVFALGAAKAPTLTLMETFAELLKSTVTTEMDLHRQYAKGFEITEADLEATEASPHDPGIHGFSGSDRFPWNVRRYRRGTTPVYVGNK